MLTASHPGFLSLMLLEDTYPYVDVYFIPFNQAQTSKD